MRVSTAWNSIKEILLPIEITASRLLSPSLHRTTHQKDGSDAGSGMWKSTRCPAVSHPTYFLWSNAERRDLWWHETCDRWLRARRRLVTEVMDTAKHDGWAIELNSKHGWRRLLSSSTDADEVCDGMAGRKPRRVSGPRCVEILSLFRPLTYPRASTAVFALSGFLVTVDVVTTVVFNTCTSS